MFPLRLYRSRMTERGIAAYVRSTLRLVLRQLLSFLPPWGSSVERRTTAQSRKQTQRKKRAAGNAQQVCGRSPSSLAYCLTPNIDTAFKQQRLKAWQPILTPKTVLPTLFIIGIIFAPIGGLLIWGSSLVTEMTFDYTDCEKLTSSASNDNLTFVDLPSNKYLYRLSAKDQKNSNPSTPRYAFLDNSKNTSVTDVSDKRQCVVEFDVPADLQPTVLLYYKLSNFYQNHRRYVKSLDSNQLKGKGVSPKTLENGDCKPLASINNTAIYPCGLIANSLFNGQSEPFIVVIRFTDYPSRYLLRPHSYEPFRLIGIISTLPTVVQRHRMARRS
jgi:hypothetical protein